MPRVRKRRRQARQAKKTHLQDRSRAIAVPAGHLLRLAKEAATRSETK